MRIFVESAGVLAPGLPDWAAARAVLSGQRAYVSAELPPPSPASLPAAERRRSSPPVRLALAAAEQALAATAMAAADMAMVFASPEASGVISQQLCEVLARGGAAMREVSPTLFHNSVHNAPSGYYSIAMGARRAAASVCRGPCTFGAGLLLAAVQAAADQEAVMYVCYDSPIPAPLSEQMPVTESTAIALILTPEATAQSIAAWKIETSIHGASAGISPAAPTGWPEWMPASWRANATARGFAAMATLCGTASDQPGSAGATRATPAEATLPLSGELMVRVSRC